jgi:hypothetical protein
MGYVRDDGITAIVYNGVDNHIHELTLVDGRWTSTGGYLCAQRWRFQRRL